MCAQQRWTGILVVDRRQGSQQPRAAVDADHVEAFAGKAAPVEVGEETLPFASAFAARQPIVDHLLLPVMPHAQSHQNRAAQRPGPGLAGEHDAVEHQRLVAPLSGRAWNASTALSRLFATRLTVVGLTGRPSRTSKTSPSLRVDSPSTKPARIDPVDLGRTPGVGAHHFGRAVAARARNGKFDVAEPGQKRAPVIAVAAIGGVLGLEALQMAIDRRRHLALDDLGQGLPAKRTIALAPIEPSARMAFTTSKAAGKLAIVAARCGMGCSFVRSWSTAGSTPSRL